MRKMIVGATLLLAMALLAVPTVSAQTGGYGGFPYGPLAPPFGGSGPGGFGFSMSGGPGGFGPGMWGNTFQGGGPGFASNATQVCTDSQGNRVFVTSSNVAQGTIVPTCSGGLAGQPPPLCTDSQGNRVFVANGGTTSGYTNCTSVPPPPGGGPGIGWGPFGPGGGPGMGGPMGFGGPPPSLTRCTDSHGNIVLVQSGGSTSSYTNCTTQS
jgi:hypothetical protein